MQAFTLIDNSGGRSRPSRPASKTSISSNRALAPEGASANRRQNAAHPTDVLHVERRIPHASPPVRGAPSFAFLAKGGDLCRPRRGTLSTSLLTTLQCGADFGWRSASSAAIKTSKRIWALALPSASNTESPWKSGASAPRKNKELITLAGRRSMNAMAKLHDLKQSAISAVATIASGWPSTVAVSFDSCLS
jgi:hypothetical protein